MAKNNKNLTQANKAKNDEFYTQLVDIENELRNYKKFFKGKTVFCNCDDPYESNFVKYFAMNFYALGLKRLIAAGYATSPIMYTQLTFDGYEIEVGTCKEGKKPYKIDITEIKDENGDGAIDLDDFETMLKKNPPELLKGNGDFRSDECVELLQEADVVVTNPPFSLFREFVAQLEKYKKDYLIIGNVNAITYKEVFQLIMNGKLWLGASIHSGDREFRVPNNYPLEASGCRVDDQGVKYIRVKGVRWYTNIDYKQRHKELILYKHYSSAEFPRYDNYDAIEVSKTADIPCDYEGVMGVLITFMDKFDPDQFEILGMESSAGYDPDIVGIPRLKEGDARPAINGRTTFARIFIRRK